jgi:dCTP deaminase
MILSDKTIKEYLQDETLTIAPLQEHQIQPASVDFILDENFLEVKDDKDKILNLTTPIEYKKINQKKMIMAPHSFILATTREKIKLPNFIAAFVEGRSSIGRMGLFIQNAGWVDPGFCGQITLELYNANNLPLEIEAGRRICQVVFSKMDRASAHPYRGKYQNQQGATSSRVFQDIENQPPKKNP